MVAGVLIQGFHFVFPGSFQEQLHASPPPPFKILAERVRFCRLPKKPGIEVKMLMPHAWGLAPPLPLPAAGSERIAIGRETSPHPRCLAWGEPPSAAPGLWLPGESSTKEITPHPAGPAPPAPVRTLPWRRRDPGTHPAAPAPVEAGLRVAGPEALLNTAADLLTSLPGWQRAEFPPTSFTFGFQAF